MSGVGRAMAVAPSMESSGHPWGIATLEPSTAGPSLQRCRGSVALRWIPAGSTIGTRSVCAAGHRAGVDASFARRPCRPGDRSRSWSSRSRSCSGEGDRPRAAAPPGLTLEDIANPHDFPELGDSDWQYADGTLAGDPGRARRGRAPGAATRRPEAARAAKKRAKDWQPVRRAEALKDVLAKKPRRSPARKPPRLRPARRRGAEDEALHASPAVRGRDAARSQAGPRVGQRRRSSAPRPPSSGAPGRRDGRAGARGRARAPALAGRGTARASRSPTTASASRAGASTCRPRRCASCGGGSFPIDARLDLHGLGRRRRARQLEPFLAHDAGARRALRARHPRQGEHSPQGVRRAAGRDRGVAVAGAAKRARRARSRPRAKRRRRGRGVRAAATVTPAFAPMPRTSHRGHASSPDGCAGVAAHEEARRRRVHERVQASVHLQHAVRGLGGRREVPGHRRVVDGARHLGRGLPHRQPPEPAPPPHRRGRREPSPPVADRPQGPGREAAAVLRGVLRPVRPRLGVRSRARGRQARGRPAARDAEPLEAQPRRLLRGPVRQRPDRAPLRDLPAPRRRGRGLAAAPVRAGRGRAPQARARHLRPGAPQPLGQVGAREPAAPRCPSASTTRSASGCCAWRARRTSRRSC